MRFLHMMRSRIHIGVLHSIAAILTRTAMASIAPPVTKLYVEPQPDQLPIVYTDEYNIHFYGLEKLHVFDSVKWGRTFAFLKEEGIVDDKTVIKPNEASQSDLEYVHTEEYLKSLKSSWTVAKVTEVPFVAFVPNVFLRSKVLSPMKYQTGGTVLAARLALKYGWAINIGGGFHHASSEEGGGFCVYADITLAIKYLLNIELEEKKVNKVMIIDLDAHQGNGHERDFAKDERVYIMDVYNRRIYPRDIEAKRSIKCKVELLPGVGDDEYLDLVAKHVTKALDEFAADIIVYNAGTDIMRGDPLGGLDVTPEGIIKRDEIVFREARRRNIPIVMVTSGGYQHETAKVIADSVVNLKRSNLLSDKYGPVGSPVDNIRNTMESNPTGEESSSAADSGVSTTHTEGGEGSMDDSQQPQVLSTTKTIVEDEKQKGSHIPSKKEEPKGQVHEEM